MSGVRIFQIAGVVAALAGCVLFLLNVQTSAHGWRNADPTDGQSKALAIPIPAKQPARDASGPAGWSWDEGTPGWRPGERIQGYPIAGATAKELATARESAVRAGLQWWGVRVVDAVHTTRFRFLAILAAPSEKDPARTCLGAKVERNSKVEWLCPGTGGPESDLAHSPALIAATSLDWPVAPGTAKNKHPLDLVGVARGDVRRIVLSAHGLEPERIYQRGHTWGQFDTSRIVTDRSARLRIYGKSGLLEVVRLSIGPGQSRIFP
jgi:hypothetical protein